MAASKQNRKQRLDVLIADACHPEPALKDVLDTDRLQSALLFRVHLSVGYVSQGGHRRIGPRDGRGSKAVCCLEYQGVLPQGRGIEGFVGDSGKDFILWSTGVHSIGHLVPWFQEILDNNIVLPISQHPGRSQVQ